MLIDCSISASVGWIELPVCLMAGWPGSYFQVIYPMGAAAGTAPETPPPGTVVTATTATPVTGGGTTGPAPVVVTVPGPSGGTAATEAPAFSGGPVRGSLGPVPAVSVPAAAVPGSGSGVVPGSMGPVPAVSVPAVPVPGSEEVASYLVQWDQYQPLDQYQQQQYPDQEVAPYQVPPQDQCLRRPPQYPGQGVEQCR